MKAIVITIVILFQTLLLFAQRVISKDLIRISKSEFSKHQPINKDLMHTSKVKKVNGIIKFATPKRTIILKDEEDFIEYNCIGDIEGSMLTLVHMLEPNSEEYYFVNRQTARIDTLVGEPIFSDNKQNIVCLQGVETDVKQKIQVGQMINGQFQNRAYFRLKGDIYPDYIYWFDPNTLFIQEGKNYWKLTYKI